MRHWTEELFIDWARVYAKVLQQHDMHMTEAEIRLINSILAKRRVRTGRVLDVPCGTGRHITEFAKRGYHVTGVDFSQHLLNIARQKVRALKLAKRARLILGDMREIDTLVGRQRFNIFLNMFTSIGYYGRTADLDFLKRLKTIASEPACLFIEAQNAEYARNRAGTDQPRINLGPDFEIQELTTFQAETSTVEGNWLIYQKSKTGRRLAARIPVKLTVYDRHSLEELVEAAGWKTFAVHHRYLQTSHGKIPARMLLAAQA